MLTIISILIFTFILFLILLFGKRYYDGIGLTKIEEDKEDESGNFYQNNDRSSYFSDEVIDCKETIASYDTCVTTGQDLVTILQYPMNGGKQCTDKVCKNTDAYDCRARGKKREVFIRSGPGSDGKFLNYYVKACEDVENLVYDDDKKQYGCKNTDIYRTENLRSGVKWDIYLQWDDYSDDIGVTKWILEILPINAVDDGQIKYPGRDSFQISARVYNEEYKIDKTIYLRQIYDTCELDTPGNGNGNTGDMGGAIPDATNTGTTGTNIGNIKTDGGISMGPIAGGKQSVDALVPIDAGAVTVPTTGTDSSPVGTFPYSCKFDDTDRKLISDTLGISHTPYTFLSHPSSYQNPDYIKLMCAEDSAQNIDYQTAWRGAEIETSTTYPDEWTWKDKSEQQRECELDYKKCISYEDFFPYHGKKYDISFGKCVPKTSVLNKLSSGVSLNSDESDTSKIVFSAYEDVWSPDLADIVTKRCDQSMYCDEGMVSSNIFNDNDMTIQYDYLIGLIPSGVGPATTENSHRRAKWILENEMQPITYSQVCTIKTE